jgi:hypothetical protein
MSKRLTLAILAQAVLDLLEGTEDEREEALAFLSRHPKVLERLRKVADKRAYVRAIEEALGR